VEWIDVQDDLHKCDVMWAGKEDEDAEPCWICGKKGEQYQHTPWRRSP
jgi:hypothetical protein